MMEINRKQAISVQQKRYAISLVLVFLLVFIAVGSTGCARNDQNENSSEEESSVFVESEFAPLKKVIVSQSEFTDQILPISQVYIPLDELEYYGGEIVGENVIFYADEEKMKKMKAEREALVSILEQYGVEVLMPRELTEEERALATDPNGPSHGKGLINEFVRDPFVVIGNHVIESSFRKEYRRYEALTSRDLFPEDCRYVALPMPDISDEEAGPFLEGGDVLVYNKQVFVGNSGYGSNSAGIEWLKNYLAPYDYEVTEIRLQGNILHLDCAMSLVREGLMIVCEESFVDGIPETFKNWDCITVPEEDAEHLAINGLPINPDVYITDIAFRDTIGKQLEDRGIKVEYLDFSASRNEAGSIHCSTQPILRKK